MVITKNSVWSLSEVENLADGLYRVLDVIISLECVVLFCLDNSNSNFRPLALPIESFSLLIKEKRAKKSKYPLPAYLFIDEKDISEQQKEKRDINYRVVNDIASNQEFIFDYATKKRVPYLAEYAQKVDVDRKKLARLLSQYWRFGQDKIAMLPAYSNSGGAGQTRQAKDKALGAPKSSRTLAIEKSNKYILTEQDKTYFRRILKKYYLKQAGASLSKTYDYLLRECYEKKIRVADACGKAPNIPSLKQFQYWSTRLFSKEEIIKQRTSENDFLKNKRSVLGSVTQDSLLIGSYFEIDATVADVHVVSELGTQYVLGRPTIYLIVDRASRMIVGMHISLFHASWRAARQAIANCFLPKVDYCKQFGVDIDESEWPCMHIPSSLVCDNGEMIGLKPQEILTPMTQLMFAPPYRPDCKGIVEKRFDILNKDVIHDLMGTTRGGAVIRGNRDPRKDAQLTIKEVTVQIIRSILEHNRSIFSDLAFSSALLIKNDLSPTPNNYWAIHLSKHQHDLRIANQDEVIARLLPATQVSMTRSGIHHNGLYYSCEQIETLNLASIARTSGRWKLDARIDENTTNFIYVRLDKNQTFIKCNLLQKSRMFEGKNMVEADFMQDWLHSKKSEHPITVTSIDDYKQRNEIAKNAKQRGKSAPVSFAEKTREIRNRRKQELEKTTNIITKNENKSSSESFKGLDMKEDKSKVLPLGRARKSERNE